MVAADETAARDDAREHAPVVRTRLLRQGKAGASGCRTRAPVGRPLRSSDRGHRDARNAAKALAARATGWPLPAPLRCMDTSSQGVAAPFHGCRSARRVSIARWRTPVPRPQRARAARLGHARIPAGVTVRRVRARSPLDPDVGAPDVDRASIQVWPRAGVGISGGRLASVGAGAGVRDLSRPDHLRLMRGIIRPADGAPAGGTRSWPS
jgi:hypothetical protein